MNPVAAVAQAIAAVFNWLSGRSALNNQTSVVVAKEGQNEANAKAVTEKAIAKQDVNEIRKEISE